MSDPIVTYLERTSTNTWPTCATFRPIDSGTDDKAGVDAVQDWFDGATAASSASRSSGVPRSAGATIWSLVGRGTAARGSCCLGMPTPSTRVGRPQRARSQRLATS